MYRRVVAFLEARTDRPENEVRTILRNVWIGLALVIYVLLLTLIIALDDISGGLNPLVNLRVGSVSPVNITSPNNTPFDSEILTEQARTEARDAVQTIYDPPDPSVSQQQTELVQEILTFIDNIRRDPFSSQEEKISDIHAIIALELDEEIAQSIIELDEETWNAIKTEILAVLPRVMRETIRSNQVDAIRRQLPTQVSVRFDRNERDVIVAIVEDLLRPNTFENLEATELAQQQAEASVQNVPRSFERGQIIIRENDQITDLDYEALEALGLLGSQVSTVPGILQALLISTLIVAITFSYIVRFQPNLLKHNLSTLAILAVSSLILLAIIRISGTADNIYAFPIATMALLALVLANANFAIVVISGVAIVTGLMLNNSLEVTSVFAIGGIAGILTLRNAERFNDFFVSGIFIALANVATIFAFMLSSPLLELDLEDFSPILLAGLGGLVIVPIVTIGILYIVSILFNIPTTFKLIDLSQPSKPLLQRLLREAPGTYQHSLQVANLAEQATIAIGANSELTHVAALYHDIGKMLNPVYFTENQQNIDNPHDALDDPYRSADIIIDHVIEGDEMAKQYRLPNRLRDFIREHHGTSQVYVFYQRALNEADGDESKVDITDFTYPGPKPQTRESGVLMLADSCEAAVRSNRPETRQEISKLVNQIIEDKRRHGQLDESGLTLNDLKKIRDSFVEVLQGIYHPRINYQDAVSKSRVVATPPSVRNAKADQEPVVNQPKNDKPQPASKVAEEPILMETAELNRSELPLEEDHTIPTETENMNGESERESIVIADEADNSPIEQVPRLPKSSKQLQDAKKRKTQTTKKVVSDQSD